CYWQETEGNGRLLAQIQDVSRDKSPNSEVIGEEPVAQKTCRFSAAASAGPISVTPDYPEHCAIFLPRPGGRSGRSSPCGIFSARFSDRRHRGQNNPPARTVRHRGPMTSEVCQASLVSNRKIGKKEWSHASARGNSQTRSS